jgi:hypothetical protein
MPGSQGAKRKLCQDIPWHVPTIQLVRMQGHAVACPHNHNRTFAGAIRVCVDYLRSGIKIIIAL